AVTSKIVLSLSTIVGPRVFNQNDFNHLSYPIPPNSATPNTQRRVRVHSATMPARRLPVAGCQNI
ncbi:MAG: hypothetical protein P8L66_05455, partial [Rhodospirillaceae bacterium]|nr:hypothetical protein [Rhodospirillaceae bacterium]